MVYIPGQKLPPLKPGEMRILAVEKGKDDIPSTDDDTDQKLDDNIPENVRMTLGPTGTGTIPTNPADFLNAPIVIGGIQIPMWMLLGGGVVGLVGLAFAFGGKRR